MKKTIGPGLAVLTLTFMTLGTVVMLNLLDPPLRSEVRKILDAPPPRTSDEAATAYQYLLDLVRGGPRNVWHVTFDRCGGDSPRTCWIDDLTPAREVALKRHEEVLTRYERLMAFGDFAALGRPTEAEIFDPVSVPPPDVHRMFTLRLAAWVRDGGQVRAWHLLESSNHFYAAVLRRGDSLLARMIALVALEANARVIEAELKRRPKWRPSPELIASLDLPDANDVLGAALEAETRVVYQMARATTRGWRRLLTRPNETVNLIYEVNTETLFADCHDDTPACVPARAALTPGLVGHLVNPLGRQMLRNSVINVGVRDKLLARMAKILELKASFRAR